MAMAPHQAGQQRTAMLDAVARAAAASAPEAAAAHLLPLFEELDWLQALTDACLAPLRDDPAEQHLLPVTRSGPALTVTLAAAPPVRLMLRLVEGAAERVDAPPPAIPAMSFSGAQLLYRLLGPAPVETLRGRLGPDGLCRATPFLLDPATPLILDERHETLRIDPQPAPLLLLTARIERMPAPPVRRHAVATGACLSIVQGDDGFARCAMLLAVLRAADARDAVPALLPLLARPSPRERWTVMRELLALDAPAAWPHLAAMAQDDPDPGVRQAAQAVLARHAPAEAA